MTDARTSLRQTLRTLPDDGAGAPRRPRLRGALIAACDAVQRYRAELNRINVFPVPDGDTGTNLALTTAAVADHLRTNRDPSASAVAGAAAEAAILGARGNCGMILSHFLLGFAEGLAGRARLTVAELALVAPAATVIATHTGPGTWGIAYQVED